MHVNGSMFCRRIFPTVEYSRILARLHAFIKRSDNAFDNTASRSKVSDSATWGEDATFDLSVAML